MPSETFGHAWDEAYAAGRDAERARVLRIVDGWIEGDVPPHVADDRGLYRPTAYVLGALRAAIAQEEGAR